MDKRLVLLTGAAGGIGSTLREGLQVWYRLRALYHRTVPQNAGAGGEEFFQGDILRLEDMIHALEGVDAVVHLARSKEGRPTFREFEVNVPGIYNVFEAARQRRVQKVVYASTNHVTGAYEREGTYVTPDMPPRPDSFYGVSKAFGEVLGRYYADHFGMSVICLRIGSHIWPERVPRTRWHLATWISPRDMVQLVQKAIESSVEYGVYYGISGNTRRFWDISNAQRELGYEPLDDAEVYADTILAQKK